MQAIKNVMVMNAIRKFKADMNKSGAGSFKIKGFKFTEGDKVCSIGHLEVEWNFEDCKFDITDGNIHADGASKFAATVRELEVRVPGEGSFVMEEMTFDTFSELKDFAVLIPWADIAAIDTYNTDMRREVEAEIAKANVEVEEYVA